MTTPVPATKPATRQEARREDDVRALPIKIFAFAFDERLPI
ncbi:MAG TPA: hypothetical protein VEZ40_02925 [Pyrinomonadaceae bacterium]|jgi:hypothetical protein|nr:hypothetical protein [Pyrinomonadaceae bacterium]